MVVTVDIDNTLVQMEVDTETTLSLMSYTTFSTLWPQSNTHHPELKPSGTKLCTYTREEITVKRKADVTVRYQEQEKSLAIMIVEGDGPTLLGRDLVAEHQVGLHISQQHHMRQLQ